MCERDRGSYSTVSAAEARAQVRPHKKGGQMGGQVEVSLGVWILRHGEVLHEIIIPTQRNKAHAKTRLKQSYISVYKWSHETAFTTPKPISKWLLSKSTCCVPKFMNYLEGIKAINSSPEGQSFSRYTTVSPSLDLGRSVERVWSA